MKTTITTTTVGSMVDMGESNAMMESVRGEDTKRRD
jgi:hypothetical protein